MSRRAGFTLVEGLVVAAVILVLMAWCLPVLQRARVAAYHVVCAGNLHQLGLAFQAYANDGDRYLPPLVTWRPNHRWIDPLSEREASRPSGAVGWAELVADLYLQRNDRWNLNVYQCPFDEAAHVMRAGAMIPVPRGAQRLSYTRPRAEGIRPDPLCADEGRKGSYFWPHRMEDAVCDQAGDPSVPSCLYHCPRGARLDSAPRFAVLVESHENPSQMQYSWNAQVSAGEWWTLPATRLVIGLADDGASAPHWSYHRGGRTALSTNLLAGDGHVANIPAAARPHARWLLARRPRGFQPANRALTAPYGWLAQN